MPEFDCSRNVILAADPAKVWEAVATGEGNAGWLFPTEIDPTGAGATAWDPPARFRMLQQQGEWFNDIDFVIEDRGDGTSALRYVHRGVFPQEGFDAQNDAVQQHTDFYLHTLGEYVAHFSGRTATYIGEVPGGIQGPAGSATPDGFRRLRHALGLGDRLSAGDQVRLTPDGLEPIEGVVDYLRPNFMGIRTADALYCLFGRNAFGAPVALTIHAFDGRDPEQAERDWQQFLDGAVA
ncbi:MAG: SRPBCC domain-containing protein [Solirubrobacteraceae bacterium]